MSKWFERYFRVRYLTLQLRHPHLISESHLPRGTSLPCGYALQDIPAASRICMAGSCTPEQRLRFDSNAWLLALTQCWPSQTHLLCAYLCMCLPLKGLSFYLFIIYYIWKAAYRQSRRDQKTWGSKCFYWARLRTRNRNSSQFSHISSGVQTPGSHLLLLSQVHQQGAGAKEEQLQLEWEHTWDVDITDGCLLLKLSLFTQQKLQAPHSQLRMHQLWLTNYIPKTIFKSLLCHL